MSTTINSARLADKYKSDVVPALMKKFGYKALMQAPKLSKICLNPPLAARIVFRKTNSSLYIYFFFVDKNVYY